MGIFSPDVWTHCNYIAETFRDMFLTHCDTSVPTCCMRQVARDCSATIYPSIPRYGIFDKYGRRRTRSAAALTLCTSVHSVRAGPGGRGRIPGPPPQILLPVFPQSGWWIM